MNPIDTKTYKLVNISYLKDHIVNYIDSYLSCNSYI